MNECGFKFDTTYINLPKHFFSELKPKTAKSPKVVIINDELAKSMGLDLSNLSQKEQAELFSGNSLPTGSTPFSQAYAGHQFEHFTMLGDGRAHIWGEHITPNNTRFDIQFKGSGKTPYSRRGDGKAALGPMLREYIISEAMYNLGIPTTRSLAVVTTGEDVFRETILPGAILTRVASSHIRVGTFQFASYKQDKKSIEQLLNYTIKRHYPDLIESENKALDLIKAVIEKQASLIVDWMSVGFIHGVMNTDNMAISGETIDYGPCAFMDTYDPNTVFSSIDRNGRYAYANQATIAQWNIARFAETLLPLIDDNMDKSIELAEKTINQFQEIYHNKWIKMMRNKLGLIENKTEKDDLIIFELLEWMQKNHADYTNTFILLSNNSEIETDSIYDQKSFAEWHAKWKDIIKKNSKNIEESFKIMKQNNPAVIPRNHKVEEALNAAQKGDFKYFHDLLKVTKHPYEEKNILQEYKNPPKPNERIYQTFCGT